jgi:ParB family chromosome partitioning protein
MPDKPLERIYDIPLDKIDISDDNVRQSEPLKDLEELAASIKKHGLLQPVVLKGAYEDADASARYELIGGQRRFLAHKRILKTETIRAVFVGDISKTQAVVRSLVENLQRVELEYGDTAEAITLLYKKLGDEKKVQKETGLSLRKIRDFIMVEERATTKMKGWLRDKKITATDLRRAIRAAQDNLSKAEELAGLIIKHTPTAHEKRRLVTYGAQNKSASARRILEEAMKPHVEKNIIISLPDDLVDALTKATKALEVEREELAAKIISEWLLAQGFSK